MRLINLAAIPNQKFSVLLEGLRYDLTFKEARGVMVVTIVRDDEIIVEGLRVVAGTPLLPYLYQENGNFMLVTENEELPEWTQFGTSQNLFYLTVAEIEAVNGRN